jgi:hypothetical protein
MERKSTQGASKIVVLIFAAVFAAILWAGFHILNFYYCYYDLRNEIEEQVHIAQTESDEEIMNRIIKKIHELHIPVDEKRINLVRQGQRMKISFKYKEVLTFKWNGKYYDLKTFNFNVLVDEEFASH